MTATVRPYVKNALMRHDTEGEWIIPGTPTGDCALNKRSSNAASRCGSPVRDNWTILSESQVEISYKAALSATPVTAPCSPYMGDKEDKNPASSPPPPPTSRVGRTVVQLSSATKPSSRKTVVSPKVAEDDLASTSTTEGGAAGRIAANVSSDEDFGYYRRKSRVAGNGSNKSRNNRKK